MLPENKETTPMPLVSVVLPTFNRPQMLEKALRSALAQTYGNFEILVRDNGGTTETEQIIQKITDPRIHYIRHPKNIGMTANVLGAFRQATGKYITNLHDDDFWEPTFLEVMVAALENNPTAVIAFSDHYIVNGDGEIDAATTLNNTSQFGRSRLAPGMHQPFKDIALIQLSVPMAMATVIRKDQIDWNDFPDLVCAYDFWLVYLACRDNGACYYHPEPLTSYRIHPASESNTGRIRLNQGFIAIYEGMLTDPRVEEFHAIFRKRLAVHYNETAVAQLRDGQCRVARTTAAAGTKYSVGWKTFVIYLVSFLPTPFCRKLPGRAH